MLVLGIDPGTAITGWALVREIEEIELLGYGVITTKAGIPLPDRLLTIYQDLTALIHDHRPDAVAVEELFFSKNVRTALSVGHARGVVLLTAAQAGLSVFHYKPAEVKQAVTGYGGAGKAQMQEMVRLLLQLDTVPEPDDAADAIAIALCHLQFARFSQLDLL